ncbi:hypothetical protein BHM03_00061368 [Ensete ventricosum]|nr:hypothetical protein BHM03_00061368 [Ensete ventricosum]
MVVHATRAPRPRQSTATTKPIWGRHARGDVSPPLRPVIATAATLTKAGGTDGVMDPVGSFYIQHHRISVHCDYG